MSAKIPRSQPQRRHKAMKKSSTKFSKTKNNTSTIQPLNDKNSGSKKVVQSNSSSVRKKGQLIVNSPYEKNKNYKENFTPRKQQELYLMVGLGGDKGMSGQKKTGAGIKNIKKKIIGQICYKTDRQNVGYHVPPLKEKSENFIQIETSQFLHENNNQITDEHQYKIIAKNPIKTIPKFTKQSFQFGNRLGKGRFGDVYIARQLSTGFGLAIKVMNKHQLKQSQMENQLIQQIKTQVFCSHPNIIKMHGCFSDEKCIYLLLELGTHGSLFQELKQQRYFSQAVASHLIKEVSSGVGYLHKNGIIHRDIKPENIINCFGVMKLCDFGWATYSPIYQRQTFCGTLDYVSPEIVSGEYYDQKVDIWCLGVLCYQLCTGKPPFESKNNKIQVYNKILNVEIQYPITLSLPVVDLLGKILDKDPKKRINLKEVEKHQWIKNNDNEIGVMIRKEIWQNWVKICR